VQHWNLAHIKAAVGNASALVTFSCVLCTLRSQISLSINMPLHALQVPTISFALLCNAANTHSRLIPTVLSTLHVPTISFAEFEALHSLYINMPLHALQVPTISFAEFEALQRGGEFPPVYPVSQPRPFASESPFSVNMHDEWNHLDLERTAKIVDWNMWQYITCIPGCPTTAVGGASASASASANASVTFISVLCTLRSQISRSICNSHILQQQDNKYFSAFRSSELGVTPVKSVADDLDDSTLCNWSRVTPFRVAPERGHNSHVRSF
jgi:hypothetical protein